MLFQIPWCMESTHSYLINGFMNLSEVCHQYSSLYTSGKKLFLRISTTLSNWLTSVHLYPVDPKSMKSRSPSSVMMPYAVQSSAAISAIHYLIRLKGQKPQLNIMLNKASRHDTCLLVPIQYLAYPQDNQYGTLGSYQQIPISSCPTLWYHVIPPGGLKIPFKQLRTSTYLVLHDLRRLIIQSLSSP